MRNTILLTLAVLVLGVRVVGAAEICGDVNASGAVTSSDALLVLRSSVGHPVAMSCPAIGELATCTTAKASCLGSLTTCNGSLSTCTTAKASCLGSLSTCNGSLFTCNNDFATCNASLAAAYDATAACEAEPKSRTIKTGQTQCWASDADTIIPCSNQPYYQDGNVHGVAFSYTDTGHATIIDNNTGLEWEKLDDNNFTIGAGPAPFHDFDRTYSWLTASNKILALNDGNFAGHADWRLPNRKELDSLADLGRALPAINPIFNTDCVPGCQSHSECSCTKGDDYYWTSTTYQYKATAAWVVDFSVGYAFYTSKTDQNYVRAVRTVTP